MKKFVLILNDESSIRDPSTSEMMNKKIFNISQLSKKIEREGQGWTVIDEHVGNERAIETRAKSDKVMEFRVCHPFHIARLSRRKNQNGNGESIIL